MFDKNGFIETDELANRVCMRTKDGVIFTYNGKITPKTREMIEVVKENVQFPGHRFDQIEFISNTCFIMTWKPINV